MDETGCECERDSWMTVVGGIRARGSTSFFGSGWYKEHDDERVGNQRSVIDVVVVQLFSIEEAPSSPLKDGRSARDATSLEDAMWESLCKEVLVPSAVVVDEQPTEGRNFVEATEEDEQEGCDDDSVLTRPSLYSSEEL